MQVKKTGMISEKIRHIIQKESAYKIGNKEEN
jgi:hypothetical protein